jgi:hypothetical protein
MRDLQRLPALPPEVLGALREFNAYSPPQARTRARAFGGRALLRTRIGWLCIAAPGVHCRLPCVPRMRPPP